MCVCVGGGGGVKRGGAEGGGRGSRVYTILCTLPHPDLSLPCPSVMICAAVTRSHVQLASVCVT
jgi:hypothetical protein